MVVAGSGSMSREMVEGEEMSSTGGLESDNSTAWV
jgi:hypothetical protein